MTFKEVYSILLEKDFRSKILALGMPQDVADYLHGMNDKYSFWFADQINKMPEYQAARNKEMFVHSLQTEMQGILDWIRGGVQNLSLKDYDWNTAIASADEYHKKLTVTNSERETNTILKEYPNGFYWVDLESQLDSCEASAMGHCGRTSKGDTLYSLRKYNIIEDNIESSITIAVSPDKGVWFQCKGRNNSKPKKEYYSYIADILVSKNILTFKTEHDSKNDFTPKDLIKYIEENPNVFPNKDELLEKINEDTISVEDFDKILDSYKNDFSIYSINNFNDNIDDNSYNIYFHYDFYLTINKSETNLPIDCLTLNYRSKGLKALNDSLEVYLSDVNVENYEDRVTINGIIEDSDSLFSLDEIGLRSFERQCEYYKELNKKFDKEEFLKEKLEKILYLDDCIEIKRDSFEKDVKKELGNFYESNVNKRTLNLTVHIKTPNDLFKTPVIEKFSYNSILNNANNTVPTEKDFLESLENYKDGVTRYADLLAITLFWQNVKRDILVDFSKHMKIGINMMYDVLSFPISFNYEYEDSDEIDYEYEFRCLDILENKSKEIQRSLLSFYNSVFVKILNNKEELNFNEENLIFEPSSVNDSVHVTIKKPYVYLGILPKDQLTTTAIKNLADSRGLTGEYEALDVSQLKKWLSDNIGSTPIFPGFRDFFESRNRKSSILFKEGLIKTYPLDLTVKKMNEKWEDFLIQNFEIEKNSFVGTIIKTNRFDLEKLKKDAEFFGYFLVKIHKNHTQWTVTFAPKFAEKDEQSINSVLYHFCPNSVLNKIKKIGITPRISTKKDWPHPGDRSYLLKINLNNITLFSIERINSLLDSIARASDSTLTNYSIIKIKNDNDLIKSLRIDPSLPGNRDSKAYGVYTNKNIPPSLFDKIMSIEEFQISLFDEIMSANEG
jgi:hypothetical protein